MKRRRRENGEIFKKGGVDKMNDTMKGNSTRWMKRKSLVNSGCDYEQKTIDKNTASINLETGNRVNKNPTRI